MQLTSLLAAAALAWSATSDAFLLPPDVKGDALEAFKAIPDTNNHWTAHIDCAGCPVAQDKEDETSPRGFVHAAELDSALVLDFSTNENNEITIGGKVVYPAQGPPEAPYTIKQVLRAGGDGMVTATEDDIGVSSRIEVGQEQKLDEDGTVAIPFQMEILGIEDRIVHVDTVSFDILRDTSGHIYISKPEIIPSPLSPVDAACTSIMCRVRAQILTKIAAAKAKVGAFAGSCMRKMGFKPHHNHHHGGHAVDGKVEEVKNKIEDIKSKLHGGPNKFNGKKPCPGKMGKHGHHHSASMRFLHGLRYFTAHVLMPIMIGVTTGLAVSAFGMALGQLVFFIYMRIRGRQNGIAVYHIIDNEDVEAVIDEEPLPKYEEKEGLPAYTDEKTEI